MKLISLLFILLSLISCREEEGIWDELTQAEQDAIRLRALNKCISDSTSHFNAFKENSNNKFYGDNAYDRGITFNHTFKEGTSVDYTHKITVWKTSATDVYLLIFIDDSTDQYRFVKIPKATNETMISGMQTDYCSEDLTLSTSNQTYKHVVTASSKKTTSTFTYNTSLLAYLSVYKESRSEQPLDSNGDPSGNATSMTGELSAATTETNVPEFDTYAEYVATGISTTLCIINSTSVPFSLTCSTDGTGTFPATELAL